MICSVWYRYIILSKTDNRELLTTSSVSLRVTHVYVVIIDEIENAIIG